MASGEKGNAFFLPFFRGGIWLLGNFEFPLVCRFLIWEKMAWGSFFFKTGVLLAKKKKTGGVFKRGVRSCQLK